jgi:hypothetical protein
MTEREEFIIAAIRKLIEDVPDILAVEVVSAVDFARARISHQASTCAASGTPC